MRHIFVHIILCILAIPVTSRAQIGYQVSLLNTATGEPRAGVTVSAAVTITDSSDKIVYTGTQQATTNDFGVLSLAVGDDATFKNTDWSKLPFFISVTVDGTLVGKSQILSVPVAEYAKKTGELTKEMLVGTWGQMGFENRYVYIYYDNGKCEYRDLTPEHSYKMYGEYYIDGNSICMIWLEGLHYEGEILGDVFHYIPSKKILCSGSSVCQKQ